MERFYWHFSNHKEPGRPSFYSPSFPPPPSNRDLHQGCRNWIKAWLILSADVLNPLVAAWSPEQKKSSLSSFQWNPLLVNTESNRLFSDRRFQEWNADEESGRKCGSYHFHMRVEDRYPFLFSLFFEKGEYNTDTDYPQVTFPMVGFCYLTEQKVEIS